MKIYSLLFLFFFYSVSANGISLILKVGNLDKIIVKNIYNNLFQINLKKIRNEVFYENKIRDIIKEELREFGYYHPKIHFKFKKKIRKKKKYYIYL